MSARLSLRVDAPRVTIGIPVYNGEDFLEVALESLLAQTFRDFELVIGDNASTDRTEEICRSYAAKDARIRYYRHDKNKGAAKNYNFVFEEARGLYFKWAAHDDVLDPLFLERCVTVLEHEPDVVAVFPRTRYVDGEGQELRVSNGSLSLRESDASARVRRLLSLEIDSDDVFMSVFGLFRSEALRQTQGIASYVASDQVLVLELALLGGFEEVPEPLFTRRLHPRTSMIKNRKPHDQAAWFDPDREQRVVMPVWGLWREHNAVIRKSGLGWRARIGCYYHLARRFVRKWDALSGEIKKAALQLFGRR